MVSLILSYTIPLLGSLSFTHTCHPEEHALVGYATFECIHVLSSLLRKLLVAYLTLLGLYGLLNVYTLSWILHRCVQCTGIKVSMLYQYLYKKCWIKTFTFSSWVPVYPQLYRFDLLSLLISALFLTASHCFPHNPNPTTHYTF